MQRANWKSGESTNPCRKHEKQGNGAFCRLFPLVFFKIVLFFFNVNKMKTLAGKMPAGL